MPLHDQAHRAEKARLYIAERHLEDALEDLSNLLMSYGKRSTDHWLVSRLQQIHDKAELAQTYLCNLQPTVADKEEDAMDAERMGEA